MKIPSQIMALVLISFGIPGAFLNAMPDSPLEADQNMHDAANSFLEQYSLELTAKGYRSEFQTGNLDPRLKAPLCDQAWEFSFTREPMKQANTTLLATCQGDRPSKLYVRVQFDVYAPAIVSNRLIAKGQLITASDLKVTEQLINKGHHDVYRDLSQVVGMIAKRNIRPERTISPNLLQPPRLINRGDQVMIIATNAHISIRMKGEALRHGVLGAQIPVRNLQSDKVIRARVKQRGVVEVLL